MDSVSPQEMRLARLGDDGTVQSAVVWAWECAEETAMLRLYEGPLSTDFSG